MIIFNITCHIERGINQRFIDWIKQEFVPQIEISDFVAEVQFLKLVTEFDDNAFAYTLQIHFKEMVYFNQFQLEEEDKIFAIIQNQFAGKIFTFTSLLEHV